MTIEEVALYDAADIIKNGTEEPKRLSQNGFQECYQHLCSRWQECVVAKVKEM